MSEEIITTDRKSAAEQVFNWLIAGQSEADIREAIGAKYPGSKPRPLILSAIKQLEKASEVNRDLIRGFAIEGTREIYRKALEVADHQTALRALKQLVELAAE